jgi:putative DNA methylase
VIRHLEPDLAKSAVTAEAGELVASTHRYGDPVAAHERYCEQLIEALGEASRVLRKDGVMALVYSHSSLGGWEALTRAIRSVPLVVTSVQPLRIERRQRPRAMGSTAINTCLVFVMRPSLSQKPRPGLDELTHEVEAIRDGPFPRELRDAGWDEADIALAVFAQAVGLLANSEIRERGSGIRGALEAMVEVVRCRFGGFEISGRRSL